MKKNIIDFPKGHLSIERNVEKIDEILEGVEDPLGVLMSAMAMHILDNDYDPDQMARILVKLCGVHKNEDHV